MMTRDEVTKILADVSAQARREALKDAAEIAHSQIDGGCPYCCGAAAERIEKAILERASGDPFDPSEIDKMLEILCPTSPPTTLATTESSPRPEWK